MCTPDCPSIPNGDLSDETTPDGSPANPNGDDGDPYSVGNSATLTCNPGYLSNGDPSSSSPSKVAKVKCVKDEVRGSMWAHAGSRKRARCMRGCDGVEDCRMDEFCNPADSRCTKVTCSPPDHSVLNGDLK